MVLQGVPTYVISGRWADVRHLGSISNYLACATSEVGL